MFDFTIGQVKEVKSEAIPPPLGQLLPRLIELSGECPLKKNIVLKNQSVRHFVSNNSFPRPDVRQSNGDLLTSHINADGFFPNLG